MQFGYISLILIVIYSQELSRRISINKNTETQQDKASIHTPITILCSKTTQYSYKRDSTYLIYQIRDLE
jgi:preprotein translocase subunit SecY